MVVRIVNKTEFMVYWIDNAADGGLVRSEHFTEMTPALNFMQVLREPGRGVTFVTMASESVDNVGKMGVAAVVGDKCPDGGAFLGRLSRYGISLKRDRNE